LRWLAGVLVPVLVVSLLWSPPPGVAAPEPSEPVDGSVSVPSDPIAPVVSEPDPDDRFVRPVTEQRPGRSPVWPGTGSWVVDLSPGGPPGRARGGAGITVSAVDEPGGGSAAPGSRPGSVRLSSASRATAAAVGAVGHVFTLSRADQRGQAGRVRVNVDYSGFADAFGGSFAGRLRLVRLPACAATTPEVPACTANPVVVDAVNDVVGETLSAEVDAGGDPAVAAVPGASLYDLGTEEVESGGTFALMSVTSSGTGDFAAT
jgi:hypothetical protein